MLVQVACSIVIPLKLQLRANVRTERNGLVVPETISSVDVTHGIAVANGVLMVKPNVPFISLITNYGYESKQLKKNQKIGLVKAHSSRIVSSDLRVTDIRGVV